MPVPAAASAASGCPFRLRSHHASPISPDEMAVPSSTRLPGPTQPFWLAST